jgi:hypothetical protein
LNAVLSSLIVRLVDGGNPTNSLFHFVLSILSAVHRSRFSPYRGCENPHTGTADSMTWLGCLTSVVTTHLVGLVLSI